MTEKPCGSICLSLEDHEKNILSMHDGIIFRSKLNSQQLLIDTLENIIKINDIGIVDKFEIANSCGCKVQYLNITDIPIIDTECYCGKTYFVRFD